MDKLFHPKKGVLTPAGNKYEPLGNKVVPTFSDVNGKTHTLDGTEKPLDELMQKHEQDVSQTQDTQKQDKIKEMSDEMDFQKNLAEQDQKEAQVEQENRNHTELLDAVKTAPQGIVEAIRAIPETVIPEIKIPDHFAEQLKWKEEILDVLKKEIKLPDFQPVVDAVNNLKFPEVKIPESKDYTQLLKDIKKALPENTDMSGVISAINSIPQPKEVPFEFKDGRLKVEVDRIALGANGGGGLTSGESQALINGATEETLLAVNEFGIPSFDTKVIDESAAPATTVITYKKNNVTVATQTISVSSGITTMSVTL